MRGLIAALVAVLSMGAAPAATQAPAAPNPLIADLVQFCMMTEGQPEAVATRAQDAGYSPMPEAHAGEGAAASRADGLSEDRRCRDANADDGA
ncbi:MAG: hypothetical protein ACK4VY_10545 [Brevundimonas sp.]